MMDGIVFDRFDRLIEGKNPDRSQLLQLVDAGYERGIDYHVLEQDPVTKKFTAVSLPVFGVRVLSYINPLNEDDVSSMSRVVEIETVPARKGEVRRSAARYWKKLAPVALWMKQQGSIALSKWSVEQAERLQDDDEYVRFSDGLDGTTDSDRRAELAELLWLVSKIYGWDLEGKIIEWARRKKPTSKPLKDHVDQAPRMVVLDADGTGIETVGGEDIDEQFSCRVPAD